MANIGTPRASFNPAPTERLERIEGRQYRGAPVRGRMLPTGLVRSTGLLTHRGTVREEWAILARALHVQHVTDRSDSEAIRYTNAALQTVETVERIPGTFQKSGQTFTEDIRRRLWRKATPEEQLQDADMRRDYERHRGARARIAPYLQDVGPAVRADSKLRRDLNGRRWRVSEELRSCPAAPEPAPFDRCTGPAPRIDWSGLHIDAMGTLAAVIAHRENLHTRFTEGLSCGTLGTRHRPKHGYRSHRWHAMQGKDSAGFVSVGRWREGEASRPDVDPAVTVPWIVWEIDGRRPDGTKCRYRSHALAVKAVRRLLSHTELSPDDLVISYSGSESVHIRIPHTVIGCPVYRNENNAVEHIHNFTRALLSDLPDVREAIDPACFRPRQMIRMIGTTHRHGGRCTHIPTRELLQGDPYVTFAHAHAGAPAPYRLPDPDTVGTYCPALARLLYTAHPQADSTPTEHHEAARAPLPATHCCKTPSTPSEGDVIGRIRGGVSEGERNRSAYLMALYLLTYGRAGPREPWERLQDWNKRNDPPLPVGELRTCYRSATRSRAVAGTK